MRQCSLFDIPLSEYHGSAVALAGLMPAMRAAMNRIAGMDDEGRKLLVDRINAVASREAVPLTNGGGKSIKKEQLDKWLQPSDRGHAPTLEAMVCFCLATGDASVFKPLLDTLGLVVVSKDDVPFLEYGRTCDALKKAREQKKKLEARL